LLDRELYIPMQWFDDQARCREAGIPETTRFQTKCELAGTMVERVLQAKIPISWVVADCVYGSNARLRAHLHASQCSYVLAVHSTEPVELQTPTGLMRMTAAEAEARFIQPQQWQRLSMGEGTKGPRWFDWACLPLLHRCEEDGRHFLLMRRLPTKPSEKVYYLVFAPVGTTLAEMVQAIAGRWCIEEDFETSKDSGMDQYEVRTWTAWYRSITLAMVAQAALAVICAQEQRAASAVEQDHPAQQRRLLPVTRPEIRRLPGQLLWPRPHNVPLLLAWSWWRRRHRSLACYSHRKRRREQANPASVREVSACRPHSRGTPG
jgi:SRSO17 transposase